MTTELTHILIFKTNVANFVDKLRLEKLFAGNSAVLDWHVDQEDVDCVLRLVSYELCAEEVISLLNEAGFLCEELQ
jgi:hypothetical protein